MPSQPGLKETVEAPGDFETLREEVFGVPIDVVSWDGATARILQWAAQRKSTAVYVCNVNNVTTAWRDHSYCDVLRRSDMTTPDGAPIAMLLRWAGHARQERIDGPDLMWKCCSEAAETGEPVFLYGGTDETLRRLTANLQENFSKLKIAGALAPPFRPLTPEEDADHVDQINRSGAGVVWVGLGCPKQEVWIDRHRGRVNAVMIGVGAAFDFHAGLVKRAPRWIRGYGLEWLYRFCQNPRRLATRYLVGNTIFTWLLARSLLQRLSIFKLPSLSNSPERPKKGG